MQRLQSEENADVIGISILSGSHKEIAEQIKEELTHYKAVIIFLLYLVESSLSLILKLSKNWIKEIFTQKDF